MNILRFFGGRIFVKFLHTADLHLKKDEPSRLQILSWIVNKAKELESDALFITGDLFDSDGQAHLLRGKVREIFESSRGLPIFLLPGNHDANSYSKETFYGDNCTLFYKKPFQIIPFKDVKIIGVPFQGEIPLSQCLKDVELNPEKDIILAHGTFYDERFSRVYAELGEEARYMPIYPWDIENKILCLALGHYHSHFFSFTYGKTQIFYPGSPLVTSRRCVGKRYAVLILTEDAKVRIKPIFIDSSPYWENLEWIVFPGKEEEKLEEIEQEIRGKKNERLMLQGKIKGFLAIGEKDFQRKAKEIEEKYKKEFKELVLDTEGINYWGSLLENRSIARFLELLEEDPAQESLKQKTLEVTLLSLLNLKK